jgi:pilus assembly protein Flp/PilA
MMVRVTACFRALVRDDHGQDLIEYALLASLIAVVAIVVIGDVGTEVARLWTAIAGGIPEIP